MAFERNFQIYPMSEISKSFHTTGEHPDIILLSLPSIMSEQLLSYFTILSEETLLICNTCRYAISPSYISRHLIDFHKQIPRPTRRVLAQEASILNFPNPSIIPIPMDPVPIIPCLEIKKGARCIICYHLMGTSLSCEQHYRKNHRPLGIKSQRGIPQGRDSLHSFLIHSNLIFF
jgi:hypothetical protein